MMPGMNPRQMQQMMKRMGIKQQEIDAVEVIIRCSDKEIVFSQPSVSKVNMMGQDTYQITGQTSERSLDSTPSINDDDIQTVMDQTGCSQEDAQKAIEDAEGDLAQAILNLKGDD